MQREGQGKRGATNNDKVEPSGLGGRISNHGLNVAYNWSIKWVLFVTFLYLTSLFLKDVFVHAMFSFILINIVLNPMLFISKNEVTA